VNYLCGRTKAAAGSSTLPLIGQKVSIRIEIRHVVEAGSHVAADGRDCAGRRVNLSFWKNSKGGC